MSSVEITSPARIEVDMINFIKCPSCGCSMLIENYFKKKGNTLILVNATCVNGCRREKTAFNFVGHTIEDIEYKISKYESSKENI